MEKIREGMVESERPHRTNKIKLQLRETRGERERSEEQQAQGTRDEHAGWRASKMTLAGIPWEP